MFKIIGILNIIIGFVESVIPLSLFIFVIPKLASLYRQSSIDIQQNINIAYLSGGLNILLGLTSIFLGFKLIKQNNNKYFNYNIITMIISFLVFGYLIAQTVLSIINPIYQLTNSIQ